MVETRGVKKTVIQIENKNTDNKVSVPYLVHKVGTQLGGGLLQTGASGFRTAGEYKVYTSLHAENSSGDIFLNDKAIRIYDNKTVPGKWFKKVFIPEALRGESLSAEEIKVLREKMAPENYKWMGRIGMTAATVETASNLQAMALCVEMESGCTPLEWATFSFNGFSSGAFIFGYQLQGKGAMMLKSVEKTSSVEESFAAEMRTYKTLNLARQMFIVMNVLQIAGGMTKVGIETYYAAAEPKNFNLSAMVNGSLHIGMGGSWLIYNRFLAREAKALARAPETLNKATHVLLVHARVIPPKILWAARSFGMLGPMIGGAKGVFDIYKGLYNENLAKGLREEKIISGLLGTASSACFVGFAFFMTPAAVPLGTTLLTGGFLLLAVQTAYDEREAIVAFFKGPAPDFGINPLAEIYNLNMYGEDYKNRIQLAVEER